MTRGQWGYQETPRRSVAKAISYRLVIICLDFTAVYLLTGKTSAAVGFMVVSNIYTTVAYFLHERLWERIAWGLMSRSRPAGPAD